MKYDTLRDSRGETMTTQLEAMLNRRAREVVGTEDKMIHSAYCSTCKEIQGVGVSTYEKANTPDTAGNWKSADIVCAVCHYVIATLYRPQ